MCHKSENGFALVSAIFLLVVLAGLGAFMATVSTIQHAGSALDVQGAKAYQAAYAGTEWGLYHALKATPSCAPSTDIGEIDAMYVTVSCAVVSQPPSEAGMGMVYSVVATACNVSTGTTCPGDASSANYVERRISVLADTTPH